MEPLKSKNSVSSPKGKMHTLKFKSLKKYTRFIEKTWHRPINLKLQFN